MKRFAAPSKSSLMRAEFRKLPIGAQFTTKMLAAASEVDVSLCSAAIVYLIKIGAVREKDISVRPTIYEKIAHDEINDQPTHGPSERVILRRKENVLIPVAPVFQSTEVADLKITISEMKVQLKEKVNELLNTLSEIDEILGKLP